MKQITINAYHMLKTGNHNFPKKTIDKYVDLIIKTAEQEGWLCNILSDRHLGDLMPSWTLKDYKYFYLANEKKRKEIKKAIICLRELYLELDKAFGIK